MEAAAAVASIAGIVTLAVQTIDGLVKFSNVLSDASSASRIVGDLLKDIDSLIKTLTEIRDILEKSESRKVHLDFGKLDDKLVDCSNDVQRWLSAARLLRPASDKGGKALFKKLRVAVNKKEVETVKREISRHRLVISLSLEALGRNFDLESLAQLDKIGDSLYRSLSNHESHAEVLRRIESYSWAGLQSSAQSIHSIDSVETRLSKLEAMIDQNRGKQPASIGEQAEVSSSPTAAECTSPPEGPSISESRPPKTEAAARTSDRDDPGHAGSSRRSYATLHSELRSKSQFWQAATVHDLEYSESMLFASFTANIKSTSSALERSFPINSTNVDCGQFYRSLQKSLTEIYPPKVARAVELRQMLWLHDYHLQMLDLSSMAPGSRSYIEVKRQKSELENALKAAERACQDHEATRLPFQESNDSEAFA